MQFIPSNPWGCEFQDKVHWHHFCVILFKLICEPQSQAVFYQGINLFTTYTPLCAHFYPNEVMLNTSFLHVIGKRRPLGAKIFWQFGKYRLTTFLFIHPLWAAVIFILYNIYIYNIIFLPFLNILSKESYNNFSELGVSNIISPLFSEFCRLLSPRWNHT